MNVLESFTSFGNTLLWSHLLIYLLIGLGLYFTFRSGFVQFRYFGETFRLLADRNSSKKKGYWLYKDKIK
ncbi:hypothetical protein [Metabacillus fastidiosus]|uniref:hypothetical protein n=1 Tax=Metabacillus fastidiosus TaxID=1458 RepID=UPI003D2E956D